MTNDLATTLKEIKELGEYDNGVSRWGDVARHLRFILVDHNKVTDYTDLDELVQRTLVYLWSNLERLDFSVPGATYLYVCRTLYSETVKLFHENRKAGITKREKVQCVGPIFKSSYPDGCWDKSKKAKSYRGEWDRLLDLACIGARNPERSRKILDLWASGVDKCKIWGKLGGSSVPSVSFKIVNRALEQSRLAERTPEQLDELELFYASWIES